MAASTEVSALIKRIIDGAFGELMNWQRPVSLPSIGPAFPEVFDRFERERSELRAAIEERLVLWSVHELDRIAPQSEAPSLNPLFDEQGRLGSLAIGLRRLKSLVPQDFVGGWPVVGKEFDLPYWSSFSTISLEALVFLSLGREPRKASFAAACDTYGRSDEADAILYYLEHRLELIANAMECDPDDGKATVHLTAFFGWIEETKLPIDPAFHYALRSRFRPETLALDGDGRQQLSDSVTRRGNLEPRERTSIAKLVAAMAIDAYGYDPTARRSPIPKEIEDLAQRLGLEITADTIRKFLREGSHYLPPDWNKNSD